VIDWKDFVYSNTSPLDIDAHGTYVSGIIAFSDPNCFGIAPNVNLVVPQVFEKNQWGQLSVAANNLNTAF